MDGRQAGVAGGDSHASVGFEMVQERADERGVEGLQFELGRRGAGGSLREAEQQSERVTVGGDGVGTAAPLGDEALGEERLERRCQGGHGDTCRVSSTRWRRRPAAAGTRTDTSTWTAGLTWPRKVDSTGSRGPTSSGRRASRAGSGQRRCGAGP